MVNALYYFSLAPYASIRDNPALTHSGGTGVDNSRGAARGATGAKWSVPARARIPKPEERHEGACFPQLFHNCGNSTGFSFFYR